MHHEGEAKLGRNVEIRASFMRHAPKADVKEPGAGATLSEAGREAARQVGRRFESKRHGIKAYTSPVDRAMETADLILGEQKKKEIKIFKSRKRTELGIVPGSKDFYTKFKELTKQNLPENFDELSAEEKEEAVFAAEDKALDWWFELGDKKFDKDTATAREVGASVALLVDKYIRMTDFMNSGSSVDLLNVSHKGTLEPFLKQVLLRQVEDESGKIKTVRGFDKLEEIGGGMKTVESWDLLVKTDEHGNKNVKVGLRGNEYDIDMEKMKELADSSS